MIESEDDVRAYVRRASGGKARWVEPTLGSTAGLPDCWVPFPKQGWSQTVHLELKEGEIKDGHLVYHVRPEQRREFRAMHEDKIVAGFLVGLKGTDTLIFLLPVPQAIAGKVDLKTIGRWSMEVTQESQFWRGVYFIFFGVEPPEGMDRRSL